LWVVSVWCKMGLCVVFMVSKKGSLHPSSSSLVRGLHVV